MNAFLSVLHSSEHRRRVLSRGGEILDREGRQRGVQYHNGEIRTVHSACVWWSMRTMCTMCTMELVG
jgi:hypothetical protein